MLGDRWSELVTEFRKRIRRSSIGVGAEPAADDAGVTRPLPGPIGSAPRRGPSTPPPPKGTPERSTRPAAPSRAQGAASESSLDDVASDGGSPGSVVGVGTVPGVPGTKRGSTVPPRGFATRQAHDDGTVA